MTKERAIKLLLIASSVTVGLLLCEIGLRVFGFSYPTFDMPDRDRGLAHRPGAEGWWRREGEAYIRINSDGLRDREHTKERAANTLRIAVLGDSYAEALQVPMENAFWSVMQRRLQECPAFAGKHVEVINFGMSGYGTAQELITLRRQVWDYQPDIVVLAFSTENDVRDNSRALNHFPATPYFIYRGDGLVQDDSSLEARNNSFEFRLRQSVAGRLFNWTRDRLRILQVIDKALTGIQWQRARRRQQKSAPGSGEDIYAQFGLDRTVFREPVDPAWKDAWRVTEGLLLLMRDEVEKKGARFFVVTLSSGIQVHPDVKVREQFMQQLGTGDLFYPDLRVKVLCERENIPVLNLAPALRAYAEQHRTYLHGFGSRMGLGHWNITGHAVAGEMIAGKLCEVYLERQHTGQYQTPAGRADAPILRRSSTAFQSMLEKNASIYFGRSAGL